MAIAGRDSDRLSEFQTQFGIASSYSWNAADRLIAHPSVDAVYIPLPNSMHAEWTVRALQAGKHVLCEKPMALTVAEADLVTEAAAANGCVLMENFSYQFAPAYRYLAKLQSPLGILWLSHSFQATNQHRLRYNLSLGGGSFLDLGCYGVDLVHRLFDSKIKVDRVHAALPVPERRAWGVVDERCGISGETSGVAIMIHSAFSLDASGKPTQNALLRFADPFYPGGQLWFIDRLFRADRDNPAVLASIHTPVKPPEPFDFIDTEIALLNAFAERIAASQTDPVDILRWRRNASVLDQVQTRIAEQLGIHNR